MESKRFFRRSGLSTGYNLDFFCEKYLVILAKGWWIITCVSFFEIYVGILTGKKRQIRKKTNFSFPSKSSKQFLWVLILEDYKAGPEKQFLNNGP